MLGSVKRDINRTSRNVVLRHPNSFDVTVYRKEVNRLTPNLLGGALVLSSKDEPDFDYNEIGEAKALFADQYAMSGFADNSESVNYGEHAYNALIESIASKDEEGFFEPKKSDILYVFISEDAAFAYEVTGTPVVAGLLQGVGRFELTKRDDLAWLPFKS